MKEHKGVSETNMQTIGNGSLKLSLNSWQYFTVYGGPYHDRPDALKGVKLAKEIDEPCDVNLPIRDFSVPALTTLNLALGQAVTLLLQGEPLYVGCMGGRGRTGLFMSILAKVFGVQSPVEYVREHYYSHAVETKEQYQFVQNYEVPADLAAKIAKVKRTSWLRFWKKNFTKLPDLSQDAKLDKLTA
jgi:hypothetical protein